MILPRKTKDGKPVISYSQITSFEAKKAFNMIEGMKQVSGKTGYMLKYFMNYDFPPSVMDVYALFGQKVEEAITSRDFSGFDKEEAGILNEIKPIGCFQRELAIDFGEFVVNGFIDDCTEDLSVLRDYKTVSKKDAKKKYGGDDYFQLDLYALSLFKEKGILPTKLEVIAIHREGSHINPPLRVGGSEVIDRVVSESRLMMIEAKVRSVVKEIAELYECFLGLNED